MKARDYTGAGFYVDISVSKELKPIDLMKLTGETDLNRPLIKSVAIEEGAWCHVFLTGGYLSCLEIFTLVLDTFPERLESFEIEDMGHFKPMHWTMDLLLNLYSLIIPQ